MRYKLNIDRKYKNIFKNEKNIVIIFEKHKE